MNGSPKGAKKKLAGKAKAAKGSSGRGEEDSAPKGAGAEGGETGGAAAGDRPRAREGSAGGARSGPMPGSRLGQALLVLLLVAFAVLTVLTFQVFAVPLLLALVFTSVSFPLYEAVLAKLGPKRKGISSGITCAFLFLVVVLPLFWLSTAIVLQASQHGSKAIEDLRARLDALPLAREGERETEDGESAPEGDASSKASDAENSAGAKERTGSSLVGSIFRFSETSFGEEQTHAWVRAANQVLGDVGQLFESDPAERAERSEEAGSGAARSSEVRLPDNWLGMARSITGFVGSFLRGVLGFIVKLAVMFFVMFYFFRDGPQLLRSVQAALPIERASQDRIVETFRRVSRSLLRGTMLTALIQGVVAGVVFGIVGIPVLLGGAAVAVAALVPILGTAIVTLPIIIILLDDGRFWQAGLVTLTGVFIGCLDNLLRPYLLRDGLRLHPVWTFIALLGGISFFGAVGLVVGPMVVVFMGTLLALVKDQALRAERAGMAADTGVPEP